MTRWAAYIFGANPLRAITAFKYNTGDHRLAAITLSHVPGYVPRNTTRASSAFTP